MIGDAEALRRAVGNLLSNALRFAPPGTAVTVAAGQRGAWAYAAVRDHGPGIPTDQQALVFDRFWRADTNGQRRRDPRTGLGLAIVRQVVESHNGTVAVHSRPGSGATFVLWLPLAPEHPAPRTPRPPLLDPIDNAATPPATG